MASAQGFIKADYNIGNMYIERRGITKDYAKAIEHYTKAANAGHAGSQFNLGLIYKTGIGTAPDLKKAKHWLELAAEQGDEEAIKVLNNL